MLVFVLGGGVLGDAVILAESDVYAVLAAHVVAFLSNGALAIVLLVGAVSRSRTTPVLAPHGYDLAAQRVTCPRCRASSPATIRFCPGCGLERSTLRIGVADSTRGKGDRMKRLSVTFVAGCALLGIVAAGWVSGPTDAQDRSEARIEALETQVSDLQGTVEGHGREIERLENQVGALRATEAAGGQPSGGAEPTPTEASDAPAETQEPAADAGPAGTRDNPIPLGQAAEVGDWTISVVNVVPNGIDAVMAENQFNDPPQEGHQFFLVTVSATYNGSESATVIGGLSFEAVGASSVSYNTYDPSCGVIPNELASGNEVFEGGAVEGNVCFQVTAEDASSLVMYVEPSFSSEDRVWFAVRQS
jgi:hypothetical protein